MDEIIHYSPISFLQSLIYKFIIISSRQIINIDRACHFTSVYSSVEVITIFKIFKLMIHMFPQIGETV